TASFAPGAQRRADEVGRRRLTVGAGHPDHPQSPRRIPPKLCGDGTHRVARLRDDHLRQPRGERTGDHQRGRPFRRSLLRVDVSVLREAADADKEIARRYTPGVVGDAGDGRVRVTGNRRLRQLRCQLSKCGGHLRPPLFKQSSHRPIGFDHRHRPRHLPWKPTPAVLLWVRTRPSYPGAPYAVAGPAYGGAKRTVTASPSRRVAPAFGSWETTYPVPSITIRSPSRERIIAASFMLRPLKSGTFTGRSPTGASS